MDPLSAVAAAASLLRTASSLTQTLYTAIEGTHNVGQHVSLLQDEINSLSQSVEAVHDMLNDKQLVSSGPESLWIKVSMRLQYCELPLAQFERQLRGLHEPVRRASLKDIVRFTKLALRDDNISRLRAQIQSHMSALQVILGTISIYLATRSPEPQMRNLEAQIEQLTEAMRALKQNSARLESSNESNRQIMNADVFLDAAARDVASAASTCSVSSEGTIKAGIQPVLLSTFAPSVAPSEAGYSATRDVKDRIKAWNSPSFGRNTTMDTSSQLFIEAWPTLAEHGFEFEMLADNQQMALLWAAAEGHAEVVKYLLKQNINPHGLIQIHGYAQWRDRDDNIAMAGGSYSPSVSLTNDLFVLQKGRMSDAALPLSILSRQLLMAEEIPGVKSRTRAEDGERMDAITVACICGHADVLDLLLSKQPAKEIKPYFGMDPFSYAIRLGRYEVISTCLRHGVSADGPSKGGLFERPYILSAIKTGNTPIVDLLLKHEASSLRDGNLLHQVITEAKPDLGVSLQLLLRRLSFPAVDHELMLSRQLHSIGRSRVLDELDAYRKECQARILLEYGANINYEEYHRLPIRASDAPATAASHALLNVERGMCGSDQFANFLCAVEEGRIKIKRLAPVYQGGSGDPVRGSIAKL